MIVSIRGMGGVPRILKRACFTGFSWGWYFRPCSSEVLCWLLFNCAEMSALRHFSITLGHHRGMKHNPATLERAIETESSASILDRIALVRPSTRRSVASLPLHVQRNTTHQMAGQGVTPDAARKFCDEPTMPRNRGRGKNASSRKKPKGDTGTGVPGTPYLTAGL